MLHFIWNQHFNFHNIGTVIYDDTANVVYNNKLAVSYHLLQYGDTITWLTSFGFTLGCGWQLWRNKQNNKPAATSDNLLLQWRLYFDKGNDFLCSVARLVVKDEPESRPQSLRKGKGRGPSSDKEKSSKDKVNKDKSRQTKHSQERPARSRSRQAREQWYYSHVTSGSYEHQHKLNISIRHFSFWKPSCVHQFNISKTSMYAVHTQI